MKRRNLIRLLKKNGWEFLRHGGDHDIFTKGGKIEAVPRSREIREGTAKRIIKRCGIE